MSYRVKITPCYSHGTCNAPQTHYATNNDVIDGDNYYNDIYEWDTEQEAQEWIDEQESGTYYLSHGEMGRPTYEIIDTDKTDEESDCIVHDASSSSWKMVDPDDLPDNVKGLLDNLNVEYSYSADDSHDIYSAILSNYGETETEYGTDYRITFCVKTTAIQVNVDDLGNVNWDNPSYYVEV